MDVPCSICKEISPETIEVGDKGHRTLVLLRIERGENFSGELLIVRPRRIVSSVASFIAE